MMKRPIFCLALGSVLAAWTVRAEIKPSPRNVQPLTRPKKTEAAPAAPRADSGFGKTTPTPPSETVVTRILFSGPTNGWGFVQEASTYYTPQGKNLGELPGGTRFRYAGVKNSSKNTLLVATVERNGSREGPYLLDCSSVVVYEGDPDTLNPDTLQHLTSYFTVTGQLAERKEALEKTHLAENPHFETAKQTQQAYQDSIDRAQTLEAEMQKLTGPRKMKADEALRVLKYEQVRIKLQADQEAAAYKAWKDTHPFDPATLDKDADYQALLKKKRMLSFAIADLLPPTP